MRFPVGLAFHNFAGKEFEEEFRGQDTELLPIVEFGSESAVLCTASPLFGYQSSCLAISSSTINLLRVHQKNLAN